MRRVPVLDYLGQKYAAYRTSCPFLSRATGLTMMLGGVLAIGASS